MYFLSKIYSFGKNLIIGLGGLCGGSALAYGIFLGTTAGTTPIAIILLAGGSIWVIQTGLMLIDNNKLLKDIRQEITHLELGIDAFNMENQTLKTNIETLTDLKDKYLLTMKDLKTNLKDMTNQVNGLEKLREDYETQVNFLKKSNTDLTANMDALATLKMNFQEEALRLHKNLDDTQAQFVELTRIKEAYEKENKQLQILAIQQGDDLNTLRSQVQKLAELYENSRKLMLNMAQASSVFSGFSDSLNEGLVRIDKTEEGLSETLTGLNNFMKKLSESTFKMLDTNNDGAINQDEFQRITDEASGNIIKPN